MGLLVLFSMNGILRQAYAEGKLQEAKEYWIKNSVRNTQLNFDELDREDPPTPREPKTDIEQFHSEFLRAVAQERERN